jgi:Flp pilus assembly protein TadD
MFEWFKKSVRNPAVPDNGTVAKSLFDQGNAYLEKGKLSDAVNCYQQALAYNPQYASAHANLGYSSQLQGNLTDALAHYRRASEIEPDLLMAHQNTGFCAMNLGQLDVAASSYQLVLTIAPNEPVAIHNLGLIAAQKGDFIHAEALLRRAVAVKSDYIEAHRNLGRLLRQSGQMAEAEASFRRVLELDANDVEARYNLGNLLRDKGQTDEAISCYRQVLKLAPDHTAVLNNLALLLTESGQTNEAEVLFLRLLLRTPDNAELHYNLGTLYVQDHRLSDAEASFNRALTLNPGFARAHNNLALLLVALNRNKEAEAAYRMALALDPELADVHTNLGFLLLTLGRYREAWPYYDVRFDHRMTRSACAMPDLPFTQWHGESLTGKSLLIWPEQGFGDYIQFIRYAPLLKRSGLRRLTLFCSQPLQALLETVAGVDAVITDMNAVLQHDYWVFPLSLPKHFDTTLDNIPGDFPYLSALPDRLDKWRNRLPDGKFRVGLVWRGNQEHKNDANRSLPGLSTLAPLWQVPGITFISLQKGQDEISLAPIDQPITALGADITDFADTAAIIAQLDLVICVDTSAAHLTGALAKPCWVLLPAIGTDWRWLTEREDSPWYASLRLFRQKTPGDWSESVNRIRDALLTMTMGSQCNKPVSVD